MRIAGVLQTLASSAKAGLDIKAAIQKITTFDVIEDDAAVIRRTLRPGRPDIIGELRHGDHVLSSARSAAPPHITAKDGAQAEYME
jgi:hypothetical protein